MDMFEIIIIDFMFFGYHVLLKVISFSLQLNIVEITSALINISENT